MTEDKNLDALVKTLPLINEMSDDVRRKLVSNSSIRMYDPNYTIYKQPVSLIDKWRERKFIFEDGSMHYITVKKIGTGVRLGDLGVSIIDSVAFPQSLKIDYLERSGKKKKVILSTENQTELMDWYEILQAASVAYKYSVWKHQEVPVVDELDDRPPALYQVVVVGVANMQMIADEDEGGGVVKLSMVCGDHFGEINRLESLFIGQHYSWRKTLILLRERQQEHWANTNQEREFGLYKKSHHYKESMIQKSMCLSELLQGDFIGDVHFFAGAELQMISIRAAKEQEQAKTDEQKLAIASHPASSKARPRRRESLFTTAKIEIVEGEPAPLMRLFERLQPSTRAKGNLSSSTESPCSTRSQSCFNTYVTSRYPFTCLCGPLHKRYGIRTEPLMEKKTKFISRSLDTMQDGDWYADKEASNPFSIAGTLSSAQSTEEAADETLAAGRAMALKEFEKAARNKRSWIRHTDDVHKRVQMRSDFLAMRLD
ncbi:hypothetical protein GUITHDRAFT_118169 [Guillardia theta CCMP2712]|uniref:PH domain-containing protein n=1 Tax=Guillardia theta (strain CCMP2712) TaxID=905079 RepID=L1IHF8_GUITC|nr:hypothetical protein GUITHDRAFT_118169 [Guillardia theta CCMP2712]EKX35678.1 hypothetical protein GUITHDRAFT_118169 [Guillardia theta CCMP2712]|eukprot:XP_005822658.1 hypothetical protein GUITHDRAFT_118169 [Guillardia theta CCMP2712]